MKFKKTIVIFSSFVFGMIISALLFSYFNSHPKKIENRIGTTGVQLIDRGLAKSIGLNRRINNLSNSYNRSKIDSIIEKNYSNIIDSFSATKFFITYCDKNYYEIINYSLIREDKYSNFKYFLVTPKTIYELNARALDIDSTINEVRN